MPASALVLGPLESTVFSTALRFLAVRCRVRVGLVGRLKAVEAVRLHELCRA